MTRVSYLVCFYVLFYVVILFVAQCVVTTSSDVSTSKRTIQRMPANAWGGGVDFKRHHSAGQRNKIIIVALYRYII